MFNGAVSLGAYEDDNLVGYLFTDESFAGVTTVRWIAVLPEYQKKGIGTQLLEKTEELAKKLGIHMIQLEVDPRNLDYYKKRGY